MSDDPKIDELIRPPRKIYEGFDWSNTERLKPQLPSVTDKILAARHSPATPLRGED